MIHTYKDSIKYVNRKIIHKNSVHKQIMIQVFIISTLILIFLTSKLPLSSTQAKSIKDQPAEVESNNAGTSSSNIASKILKKYVPSMRQTKSSLQVSEDAASFTQPKYYSNTGNGSSGEIYKYANESVSTRYIKLTECGKVRTDTGWESEVKILGLGD